MWSRKLCKLGRFSNDYVFLDKRPLKGRDTFFLLKYPNSFAAGKTAAVKDNINIPESIDLDVSVVNGRSFEMTAFTVICGSCNDNGNIVSVLLSEINETVKNMIKKPQFKQSKVISSVLLALQMINGRATVNAEETHQPKYLLF